MQLYSTKNQANTVSFKEAVFNSMPQDRGLYMPVNIPRLDDKFINNLDQYTLPEIAMHVASALIGDDIPAADLKAIIYDAISFLAPVVKLEDNVMVLELWHGPSLAFKDFGARFMSRVMSYFLEQGEKTAGRTCSYIGRYRRRGCPRLFRGTQHPCNYIIPKR